MKELPYALLLLTYFAQAKHHHHACQDRTLSQPIAAPHNVSSLLDVFRHQSSDFAAASRRLFLEHKHVLGVVSSAKTERNLALNVSGRLKIFQNRTVENSRFWDVLDDTRTGWRATFKECQFLRTWVYVYVMQMDNGSAGVFLKVDLDQCDQGQIEIFNGSHMCDPETTQMHTVSARLPGLRTDRDLHHREGRLLEDCYTMYPTSLYGIHRYTGTHCFQTEENKGYRIRHVDHFRDHPPRYFHSSCNSKYFYLFYLIPSIIVLVTR
ncbi:unnamed protein product [Acanthoscelides obtectus]|uniref:Uncharacterized protein n=1 Tax=Acanthoscelides obtectus TaxID=200917 RepID=A0A9P0MEK0_ACAOB|nr:unnamed protein product [Acanthoscelides obtectus]CAK1652605.1 hypothetical protein AOBTE_LOCUS17862 [Acanthoscelides obtectus]